MKIKAPLLSDDIDLVDYKIMRKKCDEKIVRLEAELKELKDKASVESDLSEIVGEAIKRLNKLPELYSNGNIEEKRYIIGSNQFMDHLKRIAVLSDFEAH